MSPYQPNSTLPRPKKRIRRVSKKRAALNRVRREQTMPDVQEQSGGRCQFLGCRNPGAHVHEVLTRARGGSIVTVENCRLVCDRHHRWIHENPKAAAECGWLRPRTREEHGATGQPRREATR